LIDDTFNRRNYETRSLKEEYVRRQPINTRSKFNDYLQKVSDFESLDPKNEMDAGMTQAAGMKQSRSLLQLLKVA
jgi:hypothetical protein